MATTFLRLTDIDHDVARYLNERRLPGDESPIDVLRRELRIGDVGRTGRLQDFVKGGGYLGKNTFTKRYLALCEYLYNDSPRLFEEHMPTIGSGQRVCFARTRRQIEGGWVSAQARRIGATGWWALTNVPSARKVAVIDAALESFGYNGYARKWMVKTLEHGLKPRRERRSMKRR
jgi:negative regulator of replication initiation